MEKLKKAGYKLICKLKPKRDLPTIDIKDLFGYVEETIKPYTFLSQTSDVMDLVLLRGLAKRFLGCSYLEIGTWRGESIANVSPFCRVAYSLNLSDKELRERYNRTEKYIKLQRILSWRLPNTIHIEENSRNFDFKKLNNQIDLFFIDGDHSYYGVREDTKNIFRIIHPNSIIVWHDIGEDPEHINKEVYYGILDGTPDNKKDKLYRVSNTKCAIYYPFKIKSKKLSFPQFPRTLFEVNVRSVS